eukprot:TRINITY_DN2298_c0_g1_i11.p1 TRINITY_DN2298_c0_g1~~TRINITY_DN2298_c0_g1_i11.p1  ORF type:complete len:153 (-),score=40.56 TRINITY_DN2298_c0_g1_i11:565-1023(-)
MGEWLVDPIQYFKKYDTNGDGKLSPEELKPALQSLGFNPTDADIKRLMDKADKNKDGFIEYNTNEFKLLLSQLEDDPMSSQLIHAFTMVDEDKDGYVTIEEMKAFLKKHSKMPEDKIELMTEKMMRQADENGDGKVDYFEFISQVHQSPVIM